MDPNQRAPSPYQQGQQPQQQYRPHPQQQQQHAYPAPQHYNQQQQQQNRLAPNNANNNFTAAPPRMKSLPSTSPPPPQHQNPLPPPIQQQYPQNQQPYSAAAYRPAPGPPQSQSVLYPQNQQPYGGGRSPSPNPQQQRLSPIPPSGMQQQPYAPGPLGQYPQQQRPYVPNGYPAQPAPLLAGGNHTAPNYPNVYRPPPQPQHPYPNGPSPSQQGYYRAPSPQPPRPHYPPVPQPSYGIAPPPPPGPYHNYGPAQPQRPIAPLPPPPPPSSRADYFGRPASYMPGAPDDSAVSLQSLAHAQKMGTVGKDGHGGEEGTGRAALGSKKTVFQKLIPQDDQDSRATWSKITLFSALAVWLTLFILQSIVIQKQTQIFFMYKNIYDSVTFPESLRANLVYSSSFYLAIIFGAFTTWDAILQQNLVQVLAIVAYNCGMFIFTVIQYQQYESTLSTDNASTKPGDGNVSILRGVQIMLILLTLVWWLCTGFFTYRLYQEFTWSIYRRIGGDIKLEADYKNYHIFLLCIKYSLFFTTIFLTLIFVMVQGEMLVMGLTIAIGIPLGLTTFICAYYGVRREDSRLLTGSFFSALILLGYVGARIFRMYDTRLGDNGIPITRQYTRIKTPATFFGVMAIILLLGACVFVWISVNSFKGGLKQLLAQLRKNAPPVPQLNLDE